MHFMVLSCEKMHMAFILAPDGLIWHSSPTSGPRRYATRARCWWLMPDEAIWHSNECHMHIKKIAQLRISAHKLKIETSRFTNKNIYKPPELSLCESHIP